MVCIVLYLEGKIFGESIRVSEKELESYHNYYKNKKLELREISEKKAKKINYYVNHGQLIDGTIRGLEEFYPASPLCQSERKSNAILWRSEESNT